MLNHKQQTVLELANLLHSFGFRVFIADSGRWGYYTDASGSRVVSFEVPYVSISLSGNYKSVSNGSGWRIVESVEDFTKEFFTRALYSNAPGYCMPIKYYKTLEQYQTPLHPSLQCTGKEFTPSL